MTNPDTKTNQDLLPGHYVYINVFDEFFKIGEVEPFQYDTGKESTAFFSSVASGSTSGSTNITEIEPDDKPKRNLFQSFVGVQFDMEYYFKIPTGTARFGTDETKGIGFLHPTISPYNNPNKDFQMWFTNNYYPAVDVKNISGEPLTPKIRFLGFKYELVEIKDSNMNGKLRSGMLPYKCISIGGLKN